MLEWEPRDAAYDAARGGVADPLLLLLFSIRSTDRPSSASQSVSDSRSRDAQHVSPRPQMTPRSPSPIPVPRPPMTSPYWLRHFQILLVSEMFVSFYDVLEM